MIHPFSRFARAVSLAAAAFGMAAAAPLAAQGIETIDPDTMIDGDLAQPQAPPADGPDAPIAGEATITAQPVYAEDAPDGEVPVYAEESASDRVSTVGGVATWDLDDFEQPVGASEAASEAAVEPTDSQTYQSDDLIGAAEGLFGEGAEGVARLIEDLLKEQGEPNGYIVGREGGGAFIVGVRYGSGTLYHKVEGERKVYWTGPSVGFDAGANAGSTFVLVYNLFDTQDLFRRFPAGEGQAYLVGGMSVSYVRRGDIVLIPIRAGAGLRAGVNAGYLRFSEKQRWLPF